MILIKGPIIAGLIKPDPQVLGHSFEIPVVGINRDVFLEGQSGYE